jgi:hypothetical protein
LLKRSQALLPDTVRALDLQVIPSRGLQTLLGETECTQRNGCRVISQRGYPICAAINFWVVDDWVRNGRGQTLSAHIRQLEQSLTVDTDKDRNKRRMQRDLYKYMLEARRYTQRKLPSIVNRQLRDALSLFAQGVLRSRIDLTVRVHFVVYYRGLDSGVHSDIKSLFKVTNNGATQIRQAQDD